MHARCTREEKLFVQTAACPEGQFMKSGMRKVASGKRMRVATVFTGAAACAATFAPAAHAATGHQAAPDTKTLTVPRLHDAMNEIRPDWNGYATVVSGSIQLGSCPSTPKWVHMSRSLDPYSTFCFGFKGELAFHSPDISVSRICGGNNYGDYVNSRGQTAYFGPGTTYVHLPWPGVAKIEAIQILKWSAHNNDKCPTPLGPARSSRAHRNDR